jgi:hypothetical protein
MYALVVEVLAVRIINQLVMFIQEIMVEVHLYPA